MFNKLGTTHIRNYIRDHIDMTKWGQHILGATSGTTSGTMLIQQMGDNTYQGLHQGHGYDKLGTTQVQ